MANEIESGRLVRPELSNGQLVALAATACGGAAWLFQKLTEQPEDRDTGSDPSGPTPLPTHLRGRLHAAVDSQAVRSIEQRADELAPVVQGYRERAVELAGVASVEGGKRLSRAEKELARRRKQSAKSVKRLERQAGRRVDTTRQVVGDVPRLLAGMVDNGRQDVRQFEKAAGQRADGLRRTTSNLTGEVTTMANEHVRRLQERGQEAADAIGTTLRDGSKDTTSRVSGVRDQVVSLAKSSSGDVTALINDVREDARRNLPDVAKTVGERAAEIGHQVADTANRAGQAVSERAATTGSGVSTGAAADALGRAQSAISDATHKAAAAAGPALGKVGDRIGHLSDDLRDDPSALRDRVVGQSQEALKTLQGQAGHVAQSAKDLVPAAKDLVPTAKVSSLAPDRASEARDRGLDMAALLQSNIPSFISQVTDLIEQTGDKTGTRVHETRKQGAKAVEGAEDGLQSALDRLSEAAKRAAQVGDQAVAASSHFRGSTRNAAHRTADAGKDGVESIIWLGAAGVAMYYGVLSPEQRATVNKVGGKIGRGLGKVITEVRGRDQKF